MELFVISIFQTEIKKNPPTKKEFIRFFTVSFKIIIHLTNSIDIHCTTNAYPIDIYDKKMYTQGSEM